MEAKICTKCLQEKDLEAFPKQSSRLSGRAAQCKDCVSAAFKKRYAEDPEFQARCIANTNKQRIESPEALKAAQKARYDKKRAETLANQVPVTEKTCTQCQQLMPLEAFVKYKKTKGGGGYKAICRACHTLNRRAHYAASEAERERVAAHGKEWYANNREQARASRAAYAHNNKEAHNERGRRWRHNNPEKARAISINTAAKHRKTDKYRETTARWRRQNPEKAKAGYQNRRMRHKAKGESYKVTDSLIASIWHKQKGLCLICRISIGESPKDTSKYEVDHIWPVSKGGTNEAHNLQCLCRPCNRSKAAKLPHEYAQQLGRLFL